jgi:tetratricopeptide (TPR) repeat protein
MIVAPKKLLLVLGLLLCVPSHADFPKPIAPPKIEAPAKVGTGAPSTTAGVIAPQANDLPSVIVAPSTSGIASAIPETRRLYLTSLVAKMKEGALSPQKAWDEKLLDVDDLLWIHLNSIDPWGGFFWEKKLSLRRGLTKLLAENGGEKLQPMEKLPPFVRLWLADYYQSVRDEKCLELCESIISEFKEPVKGESPLLFQAIERIAWHHGLKGKHLKAAQTWERFLPLSAKVGWWTPDALLETARAYDKAGEKNKAFFLYAKVPNYGNGWITGMSYIDQASNLMYEKNHRRAREYLSRHVTGDRADEIKVAMLTMLARSHLQTGEKDKAAQYAQKALDQFKALTHYQFDHGTEWMVIEAKEILKETAQ